MLVVHDVLGLGGAEQFGGFHEEYVLAMLVLPTSLSGAIEDEDGNRNAGGVEEPGG